MLRPGAGYAERIRLLALPDIRLARWGIACWLALQAVQSLFNGSFVLAYKLRLLGITQFLGLRTEGDDYRRFVPILDLTPAWEGALELALCAVYFTVCVQVLRRQRIAFGALATAVLLATGLWAYNESSPVFVQDFSSAARLRDLLMIAVTALLALLLWRGRESHRPVA